MTPKRCQSNLLLVGVCLFVSLPGGSQLAPFWLRESMSEPTPALPTSLQYPNRVEMICLEKREDALPFPQLYRKCQLRACSHPQHFLEAHLPQPEKTKLSENNAVQSTDQTRAGRELRPDSSLQVRNANYLLRRQDLFLGSPPSQPQGL